jgi:HAD superfamily hydrolase (TIGR01509 family)
VRFPAALIFDMDGLLVDSEPLSEIAMDRFLARRMLDNDQDLMDQLLGRRLPEAITIVKAWFDLDGSVEALTAEYGETRLDALRGGVPVMPGAREIVAWAQEHGIPSALATSSQRAHADVSLAAAGLTGQFAAEATGNEVENGKPDPDIFLLAAARLGVEPARCLVLEDAPAGLQAAKAAGMSVVWVPNDYSRGLPTPVEPDWTADSLIEVRERLETLRQSAAAAPARDQRSPQATIG